MELNGVASFLWSWQSKGIPLSEQGWCGGLENLKFSKTGINVWSAQEDEHLNNREISVTIFRPCTQNATEKINEAIPAGCTKGKTAQRSTNDQVEWTAYISDVVESRLGVETAELSEIVENRRAEVGT